MSRTPTGDELPEDPGGGKGNTRPVEPVARRSISPAG